MASSSSLLQAVELVLQLLKHQQEGHRDFSLKIEGQKEHGESDGTLGGWRMMTSGNSVANVESHSDKDEDYCSSITKDNQDRILTLMLKHLLMCCQLAKEADESEGDVM